jgi:hypothetical protein
VCSRNSAPCATARSTNARCARSARTIPPSGWNSAVQPSGTPTGHRLRASSAETSSYSRARRVERCARALVEIADELQQPVQLEQLDSRLLLELAPAGERLLRELDELEVRICEPHDARAPVAGAARVPDLELLVHRDFVALAGEGIGRSRAHDPRAHDRDVGHYASGTAIWTCSTPRGPAR